MKVQCKDCGWLGSSHDIVPLWEMENLGSKIRGGEITPYGECIECHGLCFSTPFENVKEVQKEKERGEKEITTLKAEIEKLMRSVKPPRTDL